ncbi:hypothetical protein [Sphaerisporangium aureirubrum]|uniref:Uncharacterized protein n=1 Tax=Sphaerisporangium aureirubrum TaxID=1544736 RepID=A0ABW1NFA5_9ACTN
MTHEERSHRGEPLTEGWALALWCEELPRLRADADAGGWTVPLERQAAAVADGGSAVAAWDELGVSLAAGHIVPGAGTRTRGALVVVPGQDPVHLTGDYACPHRRCPRRATRNARGEPPACALDGAPMRFVPAP